jgi:hypothetical protein
MREVAMRRTYLAVLLTVTFLTVAEAAGPIPAQITVARYVALGYDTGDRFVPELEAIGRPELVHPDELAALANLHDQLEAWGYFVVTTTPKDADLLFAVRKGRRVLIGGGLGSGGGQGPGLQSGGSAGVQVSSGDDMLSIYDAQRGASSAPLWRERQSPGKSYPGKLFDQLKQQVEAAPKKPASKPPASSSNK